MRGQKLAKLIVSPSITPPAMNKYTKVDPVVRQLCLLSNFFGLFRRALSGKVGSGKRGGDGDNESDMSQDACVGAPRDEVRHFRKIGRLKLHRANEFMARRFAAWTTLIWIAVCDPVMVVHYKFLSMVPGTTIVRPIVAVSTTFAVKWFLTRWHRPFQLWQGLFCSLESSWMGLWPGCSALPTVARDSAGI